MSLQLVQSFDGVLLFFTRLRKIALDLQTFRNKFTGKPSKEDLISH